MIIDLGHDTYPLVPGRIEPRSLTTITEPHQKPETTIITIIIKMIEWFEAKAQQALIEKNYKIEKSEKLSSVNPKKNLKDPLIVTIKPE